MSLVIVSSAVRQGATSTNLSGTGALTTSRMSRKPLVKLKNSVVVSVFSGPYCLKTSVVSVTKFPFVATLPLNVLIEVMAKNVLLSLVITLLSSMPWNCMEPIPTFMALVVAGRLLIVWICRFYPAWNRVMPTMTMMTHTRHMMTPRPNKTGLRTGTLSSMGTVIGANAGGEP